MCGCSILEGCLGRPHFRKAEPEQKRGQGRQTLPGSGMPATYSGTPGPKVRAQRGRSSPGGGGVGKESHRTGRQTDRKLGFLSLQCTGPGPQKAWSPFFPAWLAAPPVPLKALEPSSPSPQPGLLVPLRQVAQGGAPGKEGRMTRFGFPSWAPASWVHLPPLGNKLVTWIPEVLSWYHRKDVVYPSHFS